MGGDHDFGGPGGHSQRRDLLEGQAVAKVPIVPRHGRPAGRL